MSAKFAEPERLMMDELAGIFEGLGMSPLLGRICGLLIFCKEPLSLQRISDKVKISRAAGSINLRNLVAMGLVKKLPPGTDRRDYYMISSDFAQNLLNSSFSYLNGMITTVDECIEKLPHPSVLDAEKATWHKETLQRLEDFRDVIDVYQHSLESSAERIKARQQTRQRRRV